MSSDGFGGMGPAVTKSRFGISLCWITDSSPENAPPQMNKIFEVSTCKNSCWGCFLPPCGGTEATVPSISFRRACWTPSPETSLVIEGLSDLRAILSISSIYTIPNCAFSIS